MSFILDALRKSDRERQSNQDPGIAQLWIRGKRGNRAFWLPLVLLLAGLNISLLLFLWIKGDSAPAENFPAPEIKSQVFAPQPVASNQRPAISAAPENQSGRRLTEEMLPSDAVPVAPTRFAAPESASTSTTEPPGNENEYANLPSLMELTLAGTINLKPLHLDIHVYSKQPAERFAFINMSKYREGDTLTEGPRVEAITSEGVVLIYKNRSFILARE